MNTESEIFLAKPSIESYLNKYLELSERFEDPPLVELSLITRVPEGEEEVGARDIAITTAYQCYAPGITKMRSRSDKRAQRVADSTLEAGHHTTRLHAHFTWHIVGVSRNVVHEVFHSFPFYNTEQQSQRYVEAKKGSYIVPRNLDERQKEAYLSAADFTNESYFRLFDVLEPEVEKKIKAIYPEAGWRVEKTKEDREKKIGKLSQEIARYVLPIAQKTTFFYTLSELQLLRLFRATQMNHYSDEARYAVAKMVIEVSKNDPTILEELDQPFPGREKEKFSQVLKQIFSEEFDKGLREKQSVLQDSPQYLRQTLYKGVRNTLGLPECEISESEAIRLLVDPSINKYLSDVYDVGMFDPLTLVLRQASLSFATKLSHTADSQRQRHRRTPGATQPLETFYSGEHDFITPLVIKETPHVNELYEGLMRDIYKNVENLLDMGVETEDALMLLPNAHAIRVVETGDLFDWIHRWKQRLCYLAQEEIFFISVEQAEEAKKILPEAKNLFLAPCGVRQKANVRPRCPEGDRWCGQPVHNWQIEEYKKGRLV